LSGGAQTATPLRKTESAFAVEDVSMLKDILTMRKSAIAGKWLEKILESYPPDSRKFFGKDDPFGNPVGHVIADSVNSFIDELTQAASPERAAACLDEFIRIRAVQEFSPGIAVGFVLRLKEVIRESIKDELNDGLKNQLTELDEIIDMVTLNVFDKYMEYREKVFAIKANEIRNRSMKMIERINRKYGFEPGEED